MYPLNTASKPNANSTILESESANEFFKGLLYLLENVPVSALIKMGELNRQAEACRRQILQIDQEVEAEPTQTYAVRRQTAMRKENFPEISLKQHRDAAIDVFFDCTTQAEMLQGKAVRRILAQLQENPQVTPGKPDLIPVAFRPEHLIDNQRLGIMAASLPDCPDKTALLQLAEIGKALHIYGKTDADGIDLTDRLLAIKASTSPLMAIAEDRDRIEQFGVSLDELRKGAVEFERERAEATVRPPLTLLSDSPVAGAGRTLAMAASVSTVEPDV